MGILSALGISLHTSIEPSIGRAIGPSAIRCTYRQAILVDTSTEALGITFHI